MSYQYDAVTISRPIASGRRRRRVPPFLRRLLGGLLTLALIAGLVAAYFTLTGFFNANGTWYGTMYIHTGLRTVAVETYMEVSTAITGDISGKGTFCVPLPFNNTATVSYSLSGKRVFLRPGSSQHDQQGPLSLTAQEKVPLLLGLALPLGPSLHLEGNATAIAMHLTGGDGNASATLDMTHGSESAFMKACSALSPFG